MNGYAIALLLSNLLSEFLETLGWILFFSFFHFPLYLNLPFFVYHARREFAFYRLLFIS